MTIKELFDFITDGTITDVDEYLEKLMEIASQRTIEDVTDKEKVEEEARRFNYCGMSYLDFPRCFESELRHSEMVASLEFCKLIL